MTENQLEELKRIVARIDDQDNRATADVFFVVFEREEVVVPPGYGDYYKYIKTEDDYREASKSQVKKFDELQNSFKKLPKGWRKFYLIKKPKFVQAFFTEEGAKNYLEINGHNLKEPFIYGDSLYRNNEMKTVKASLKELLKAFMETYKLA